MAVSILHPWAARAATLRNAWRLAYQLPIAAPVLGPALLRDGRLLRAALGRLVDAARGGGLRRRAAGAGARRGVGGAVPRRSCSGSCPRSSRAATPRPGSTCR